MPEMQIKKLNKMQIILPTLLITNIIHIIAHTRPIG